MSKVAMIRCESYEYDIVTKSIERGIPDELNIKLADFKMGVDVFKSFFTIVALDGDQFALFENIF
jgi:hypothetical protein